MSRNGKFNPMLDLLYRSFDSTLSDKEKMQLEEAMQKNPGLKDEARQIQMMRDDIKQNIKPQFEPLFADRVLFRLQDSEDDFLTGLLWSFKRVAIVSAAAAVLLVVSNFITSGELSFDSILGLQQLTLEETLSMDHIFGEQ